MVVDDRPPRRLSNGRIALLVAAVVAALALIGFAVGARTTIPRPPTAATTGAVDRNPHAPDRGRIATAKNPSILVLQPAPDGWDDMEPVEVWDAPRSPQPDLRPPGPPAAP